MGMRSGGLGPLLFLYTLMEASVSCELILYADDLGKHIKNIENVFW